MSDLSIDEIKKARRISTAILKQQRIMEPVTEKDWRKLLGKKIGRGMSRDVYEHKYLPGRFVIKVERRSGHFQNVKEYENWRQVAFMEVATWFAPCVRLSRCGRFLMQFKTNPIAENELPARVPGCFTDFKAENWGMFKTESTHRRPVCHDYGLMLFTVRTRMRKSYFGRTEIEP